MAHAQKPDLVFQRNGRVHLNQRGSQFSRLLAAEECGSAGRPWIDHVPRYSARVVATLSNRLFPLHFPSLASPWAITFRTASTRTQLGYRLLWLETFPVSLTSSMRMVEYEICLGHVHTNPDLIVAHFVWCSVSRRSVEQCRFSYNKTN